MKSSKNNKLISCDNSKLCELHNDNRPQKKKTRLMTHKSYKHTRIYHPLKKRKINLNKIQFAFDVSIENLQKAIKTLETSDTPVLSKRYFVTSGVKKSNWSHEKEIIDWLISVNIDVARLDSDKFLIKNKVYSFNMVLILANKKRRELGFRPFYVDGITEH